MNRAEAQRISDEMEALSGAESILAAIAEGTGDNGDASTAVEALEAVCKVALDEQMPGDLFDNIEAIAMSALEDIKARAREAAVQAAKDAGIDDYTLPEPKAGDETAELEKPEPEAPAAEAAAA